jgi:PAS domain S-box-containing protein
VNKFAANQKLGEKNWMTSRQCRYGFAVLAAILAFLLRQALVLFAGDLSPYITFYPAVITVAVLAGMEAGLLFTVLAALATAYWILPPKDSFLPLTVRDATGLALFTAMGALMSWLAELYHRARDRAASYEKKLALRESETRYRFLFENMIDGFAYHRIITDENDKPVDYIFLEVNDAFERLTGLKKTAVINKRVTEVLPGIENDPADWIGRYGKVALTGEVLRFEQHAEPLGKWYSVSSYSPMRQYFVAIFEDITERKRMEMELKQSNAELATVNKELEAFSYTVSHDLKAPLRSIQGFSQALLEDYGGRLDQTGKDYLMRVHSASQRMTQLIDAMLNMARLTRGELHEYVVDLSSLAQIIAHELQKQNPERHVEFIIADNVKACCDQTMMQVMLHNLLDNAWKFTSNHETAKIEFGVVERDGKTVFFVKDDGAGFDMKYADKLFSPFKRFHSESEFPGIGIGLAIAHRIVMRHGGKIWAESAPNKGATFYFTL